MSGVQEQLSLLGSPPQQSRAFADCVGGGVVNVPRLVVDLKVRSLCRRPYPLHPRGCPNYGKRQTCPPAAKPIADVISLDSPVWVAWNEFDLAAHVERMRAKHQPWSDRQLRCCLYWQQRARKQLDLRITGWRACYADLGTADLIVLRCPEACGVNVTETVRLVGVEIEWPPVKIARQVALIGSPCAGKEGAK